MHQAFKAIILAVPKGTLNKSANCIFITGGRLSGCLFYALGFL